MNCKMQIFSPVQFLVLDLWSVDPYPVGKNSVSAKTPLYKNFNILRTLCNEKRKTYMLNFRLLNLNLMVMRDE